MNLSRFCILLTALLFFVNSPGFSQFGDPPATWSQINDFSIFDKSWDDVDPNAHAIILSDFGQIYFNRELELRFKRHVRILILDPDQSDYTTISISHNPNRRTRRLDNISAQTLNYENGRLNITELGRNEFFEERGSDNWRTTRFTFPAVQSGSVVEYSYEMTMRNITILRTWYFDNPEPTLWSEYRLHIPDVFVYNTFQRMSGEPHGYNRYLYNIDYNLYDDFFGAIEGVGHRFVMTNRPALREEPLMTTLNDYRSRIQFQLREIRRASMHGHATANTQDVLDSWHSIISDLYRSRDFGREIRVNRAIRNKISELTDGLDSDLEKAKAIYNFVTNSILWDGRRGIYPEDVRDAFSNGTGNGPDITLLFIAMLQEIDIEATPLLVSRRNHGLIDPEIIFVHQFNHIIAHAEIEGESYLLEPLYRDLPFGMLTPGSHNGQGLEVVRRNPEWIDISATEARTHRVLGTLVLDENGALSGQIQSSMDGYEAYDYRRVLRERGLSQEDFVLNTLLSDVPGSEAQNIEITGLEDPNQPINTTFNFNNDAAVMQAGDFMYFNPFILLKTDENPFQNPTRTFPVTYDSKVNQVVTLNLMLPDGYEVDEMPRSIEHQLGDYIRYRQIVRADDSMIQISTSFMVNKLVFQPSEYLFLRRFYNNVVSTQNEQIVLRRITETEETTATSESDL